MKYHQHSKKKQSTDKLDQCGVALVEAILSIPILLVFAFGLVDLGSWMIRHYVASRVVYEVSRAGAGIADLRESMPGPNSLPMCVVDAGLFFGRGNDIFNGPLEPACLNFDLMGHCLMHQRAQALLNSQSLTRPGTVLSTCYNEADNFVETSITIPYRNVSGANFSQGSWIYNWRIWPDITARARSPYLYN